MIPRNIGTTPLSKSRKSYDINQSPFFKLRNKRKLASLFDTPLHEILSLIRRNDNYRVFMIQKNTPKSRQVEVPKPQLERLHRRTFNLLARIETPKYLYSGVKGRSYIDNARQHVGQVRLITLDIERFFPSTKGWHVYQFFHEVLKCSPDVSNLMASICTYDDHVPTGSCLSQIVAFFAHFNMFEAINDLAKERNLVFTCYVDDIAISGNQANRSLLFELRGILSSRGLRSKKEKEYAFDIGYPGRVTGSIVTENGLKLPNTKHRQIHEETLLLSSQADSPEKLDKVIQVLGRAIAASQVDQAALTRVVTLVQEKNRIKRICL